MPSNPDDPLREVIADGAMLLRGSALPFEADILNALQAIVDQAPFRYMTTPGGYVMSVAMTNCGAAGWITDRTGYRYDRIDPEAVSRGQRCLIASLNSPSRRLPKRLSAFHVGRPLFPEDVRLALADVPSPRMLVTTPLHIRACVTARSRLPHVECMLSATAPLPRSLAKQAETLFQTRVYEVYGFTEAGSRRDKADCRREHLARIGWYHAASGISRVFPARAILA